LVAVLEAIAVRAVMDAQTIQPFDALKPGHIILQTGREKDFPGTKGKSIRTHNCKLFSGRRYSGYPVRSRRYSRIPFEFRPTLCQQVTRGCALVAEQAMDRSRRLIARRPPIAEKHAATASPENDRSAEAGRTASHNDDIKGFGHAYS
jgi:hypothetical protein